MYFAAMEGHNRADYDRLEIREATFFDWRDASLNLWTSWENVTGKADVTPPSPYSATAVLLGKAHKGWE